MNNLPSIEELRSITEPESVMDRPNGEHWMGKLFFRRISPYFTREALRLGLSANQVTVIMIIFGLIGSWMFSLQGPIALLGFLGIQIYLLLDSVDGEVARYNKSESAIGIYLDRWGHYVVEGSIFIAFGFRASQGSMNGYAVLGLAGGFLALLSKAETDLVDSSRLHFGLGTMPKNATEMQTPNLATGRRLVRFFPFHRLLHASEASIIGAVLIIIEAFVGELFYTKTLVTSLFIIAAVVMPLHLVSILNSTRLTSH